VLPRETRPRECVAALPDNGTIAFQSSDYVSALRSTETVKQRWVDPALYFGFVFVLTAPFLVASTYLAPLAPGLPASAVAVVCPTLAALIVIRLFEGREAQRRLIGCSRLPANKSEWH